MTCELITFNHSSWELELVHESKLREVQIKQLERICNSMTLLLSHTVAQPTKWRFLPKNLSQLVIFVIELAFT